MNSQIQPQKSRYKRLGELLRNARKAQHRRVKDVANQLDVSPSLVYQVEQGGKKPKRTPIELWASVYGIDLRSDDLWEALLEVQLPLYLELIKKGKEEKKEKDVSTEALAQLIIQLGVEDRNQAMRFIEFLLWQKHNSKV